MLKLTQNSCLDIKMDNLQEKLDRAKVIAELEEVAYVTTVVDGTNKRDNETEFDALLRRCGIPIEARDSYAPEVLARRTLLDLQNAVAMFVNKNYNLDGYYVFLDISNTEVKNIIMLMSKELE